MAKLFIFAGHGAGDPGACANGYQEAERVRVLAKRVKELGGDDVILGDVNRNYYADNGINSLDISTEYKLLELHLDSASGNARGGHVIINGNYAADEWDEALAAMISSIFPGRSKTIVGRTDLANPSRAAARGYNYRLMECCFISSAEDMAVFNANIDTIAKGILAAFGIEGGESVTPVEPESSSNSSSSSTSGSIDDLAQRVINGEFGNGDARKQALGSNYDAVQARVNEILGGGGSSSSVSVNIDDLAQRVINGEFGNGDARKQALGSNYDAVQARVNEILGGGSSSSSSVDIDDLARRTINGEFGNGDARKQALGSNYAAVQKRVNEMLS